MGLGLGLLAEFGAQSARRTPISSMCTECLGTCVGVGAVGIDGGEQDAAVEVPTSSGWAAHRVRSLAPRATLGGLRSSYQHHNAAVAAEPSMRSLGLASMRYLARRAY